MQTTLRCLMIAIAFLGGVVSVAVAGGPVSVATPVLFDAAPGIRFDPSIPVQGSIAILKRKGDSVWVTAFARRLPPGAYTNWWVVFNNPEFCVNGCGADDFPQNGGNPDVNASVFWATGGVVGDNGRHRFKAHLTENNPPGQVLFGDGLKDAQGAEIHYIIRYHGPTNTNLPNVTIENMITTLSGGCTTDSGNFPCYDPQAVVFPLPDGNNDD